MSNYDPKNIPTLDDVIEEKDADKPDIADTTSDELTEAEENNFDLFSSEPVDEPVSEPANEMADSETEAPIIAEPELQPIAFDDSDVFDSISADASNDTSDDISDVEQNHEEHQHYPEAAQITVQITYQEAYDKSVSSLTDQEANNQETDNAETSISPIELETVVADVVKQLLPDLEQQLRFLIQQALEEKLPAEIIKPADTDTDTQQY
jgi:hypothetical protein